ncbi:hypothetical protein [Conexibacter woesei]|uniref:Uncharacterized protein n=1 Tax=Conexibacter woesei (strain DSM 14684 / CCUG 47730 / CIP 108061 / JCM 11494 / NBRC 100937 / ID131577) TaxID=469383 RepID=D3F467_CONWI|nr:hypothetical protein [Conexibacter woesei]ADB50439.1 hypothetical protein Cwoe_2013 [Conexibacter woesei DSM 14684]
MDGKSFTFDPRAFISPPYVDCPLCQAAGEFGVLMISGTGYVRRCRRCMRDQRFLLPAVEKKVLYLDQFAVSNLMKVLHPRERLRMHSRAGGRAEFWLDLFVRLDRLVKLQLLVCPSSTAHWEESLPTRFFQELRRMYEHLSGDVSFEDPGTIRREQAYRQFLTWQGEEHPHGPLTVHDVTHGVVNGWLDRISVQARLGCEDGLADDLRMVRDRTHTRLATCVDTWARGGRLGFERYFEQELSAYGPQQWRNYCQRVVEVGQMMNGLAPFDPDLAAATNDAEIMVMSFKAALRKRGIIEDTQLPKIREFFASDQIKEAPFLRISCAMFAAMAVEASVNQAPRPDRGMWTDITTVSTLLPYCDAMLIDNRCHRLLGFATDRAVLDYDAAVFSTDSRDKLLAWLEELEASATPEYLGLVEQVYGASWLEPYSSMFEAPTDPR